MLKHGIGIIITIIIVIIITTIVIRVIIIIIITIIRLGETLLTQMLLWTIWDRAQTLWKA